MARALVGAALGLSREAVFAVPVAALKARVLALYQALGFVPNRQGRLEPQGLSMLKLRRVPAPLAGTMHRPPQPTAPHEAQDAGRCNPRTPSREMPVEDSPGDFESALKPLWLRAQSGDDAAYRHALRLLATRLRAYLKRRLAGLPDEVEDLVQETLLALHLQRGTYDPALPVSAWAVAIARHKLVDLWRRRGRRDHLHDTIDDVDEQLLAAEPDDGGARRDLQALFQALPQAQQQAIVLTKLEGLSVAEAAARTGASESAIKVQVHRGLKRLAALVRGDGRGHAAAQVREPPQPRDPGMRRPVHERSQ